MKFPTMWYVRPAKAQTSLRIPLEYSMNIKLLTEHHLEFLSLKGIYTGSSEPTLVQMPHCWKSQVTTHLSLSASHLQAQTLNIILNADEITVKPVLSGHLKIKVLKTK